MSRLPALVPAALALALAAPAAAESVARLNVTIHDGDAETRLPGPFVVAPGGRRVVMHVPASRGLFVLESDRLLQHLPLPAGFRVQGLAMSDSLLAAGGRPEDPRLTAELRVFDPRTGSEITHVQSANPFLKVEDEHAASWRLVADDEYVGVFHPSTAASYPLWKRGEGVVMGQQQIGRAVAGLGFAPDGRWIPGPDGSASLRREGRTAEAAPPAAGRFVGGLPDGTALVVAPEDEPEAGSLPRELALHAYREGNAVGEIRLTVRSRAAPSVPYRVEGPLAMVRNGRLFWLYLGHDYVEIRTIDPAVTLSRGR